MIFDTIIVGTSPLALIFAALEAKRGRSVCILEKSHRVGGAWALENALGLSDIETSPHVFLPNAQAYELLDRHLDSRFQPLTIKPKLTAIASKMMGLSRDALLSDTDAYLKTLAWGNVLGCSPLNPRRLVRRICRLIS
jgi:phytoene dehydrogenase-like protein